MDSVGNPKESLRILRIHWKSLGIHRESLGHPKESLGIP